MHKIIIGIIGPHQSGKSLLVNCLLNRPISKVGKGSATTHTPVFYYYSNEEYAEYFDSAGSHLIDVDDVLLYSENQAIGRIDVYLDISLLKAFTVVDLPGTGFNEDDDKTTTLTFIKLDVAILLATDVKEFTSSSSFYSNALKFLKNYSIPYYFFLNCTNISCWSPSSRRNIEIANSDLVLLEDYEPLCIDDNPAPVINLMWYWCSQAESTDELYKDYYKSILNFFEAKRKHFDIQVLEDASNFRAVRSIFSRHNRTYLEIKKDIKYATQYIIEEVCPIGTIQTFAFHTIPQGWLLCDGSAHRICDYPELYSIIRDTFGDTEEGSFILPDLRGRFIRGWDNARVIENVEREFGSYQNDSIQKHTHIIPAHNAKEDGSHTHRVYFDRRQVRDTSTFSSDTEVRIVPVTHLESDPIGADPGTTMGGAHSHKISQFKSGGINNDDSVHSDSETRPYNIALLYCIKAENLTQRGRMHENMRPIFDVPAYPVMNNNSPISGLLSQDHHTSFKEVSHFSEGRVRCLDNDGWVFITPNKKYINHYEDARDFSEKRAAIKVDGKWGFIDYDDNIVISCLYSRVGDFAEGVAYYEKPLEPGGKYSIERGFINYEGKQVLSLTENYSGFGLEFDDKFNYGLFKIYSRVHAEWINHEGKIVNKYQGKGYDGSNQDFSVRFESISDWFAYGDLSIRKVVYYSPQTEEEQQMSSDFFGAFTEYDTVHLRFDVKRNIIEIFDGEKKSLKNEIPEIVKELASQYSTIDPFVSTEWKGASYERARVQKNGLWGFIDEVGKLVIPCVFSDVQNYSEGYAAVCRDNAWFFIDVFGKQL